MPGDFQSQSRVPAYIGQDRRTIEPRVLLLDWHRRPKRYPPRLGDAVEVTGVQIWSSARSTYLQKVPEQFVTYGDQPGE